MLDSTEHSTRVPACSWAMRGNDSIFYAQCMQNALGNVNLYQPFTLCASESNSNTHNSKYTYLVKGSNDAGDMANGMAIIASTTAAISHRGSISTRAVGSDVGFTIIGLNYKYEELWTIHAPP